MKFLTLILAVTCLVQGIYIHELRQTGAMREVRAENIQLREVLKFQARYSNEMPVTIIFGTNRYDLRK